MMADQNDHDHDCEYEDDRNEQNLLLPTNTDHTSVPVVAGQDNSRCISCRHILAFIAFLGFINVYCLRVNLSVALVAMVNQTFAAGNRNESNTDDECLTDLSGNSTGGNTKSEGEMNWDSHKQALVLASFFYGYIVTQVCLSLNICQVLKLWKFYM
jgi:hypothetical protein